MALASISVRGFRNLEPTTIEFVPGSNYLFGPNGAGKTNLLEAIHYLAIGRSFRRSPDAELLGFGRDVLVVSGADGGGERGEIRFDGREKRVLRNDIKTDRLSDYFGWLPVVVLLLEDIELVRGSPGVRRSFLDVAVAKAETGTGQQPKAEVRGQSAEGRSAERSYIELVGQYRRAVVQCNRLLEKGSGRGRQSGDEVAVWEEELVRTGVRVYERRAGFVERLLGRAAAHYERLTGHMAGFNYRRSIGPDADVAAVFRARLAATRDRALALGHVLVGPHRDDVRVSRGERDLRKFGSVGEQRLAGVALRLAEADMLLAAGRQRPVFLLDEVASELDELRSRMVMEMVEERGQMVYAAARRTARLEVRGRNAEVRRQSGGQEDVVAVSDGSSSPGHLSTGPLEHSSGKEFHVEAGVVRQVS